MCPIGHGSIEVKTEIEGLKLRLKDNELLVLLNDQICARCKIGDNEYQRLVSVARAQH